MTCTSPRSDCYLHKWSTSASQFSWWSDSAFTTSWRLRRCWCHLVASSEQLIAAMTSRFDWLSTDWQTWNEKTAPAGACYSWRTGTCRRGIEVPVHRANPSVLLFWSAEPRMHRTAAGHSYCSAATWQVWQACLFSALCCWPSPAKAAATVRRGPAMAPSLFTLRHSLWHLDSWSSTCSHTRYILQYFRHTADLYSIFQRLGSSRCWTSSRSSASSCRRRMFTTQGHCWQSSSSSTQC